MTTGRRAWSKQLPLADRWHLVVPSLRGYVPNPPGPGYAHEVHAGDVLRLLGDGAHVVGHSFGGLIAMTAAARRPELVHSLTLIEPAAHALLADSPAVRADEARHARHRSQDAEDWLDEFLNAVGLTTTSRPRPMSQTTAQHLQIVMDEPPPWRATLPIEALQDHSYPVLVLSGGRKDTADLISHEVVRTYGGDVSRREIAGAPHDVASMGGPVNDVLEEFWRNSPPGHRRMKSDSEKPHVGLGKSQTRRPAVPSSEEEHV